MKKKTSDAIKKRKIMRILGRVCKEGLADEAYKGMKKMKLPDGMNYLDAMFDFFEPIDASYDNPLVPIHFGAFTSYIGFLMSRK